MRMRLFRVNRDNRACCGSVYSDRTFIHRLIHTQTHTHITAEVSTPTNPLMMSLSREKVKTHIRMLPKRRSLGP